MPKPDTNEGPLPSTVDTSADDDLVEFLSQWNRLGREAVGLVDGQPRRFRAIMRDCDTLAVVAVWIHNGRNVTHAAASLGMSRRTVRERVKRWKTTQGSNA